MVENRRRGAKRSTPFSFFPGDARNQALDSYIL